MVSPLTFLLNKLKENDVSAQEKRELISSCSNIALIFLSKKIHHEYHKFLQQGLTLQDIAADAITPLFIEDKSGELPLRKALLNWDKEIADEASAYYFLSKIIGTRIEQEHAKKLKEADPFFGKILRSFNHLVETNKIKKVSWFGVVYLVEVEQTGITQKPLDAEFIENLPASMFVCTNEKIVNNIFHRIKTETDLPDGQASFFPAIPLNALIRKIKQVNGSFLQQSNPESKQENFEEALNVERVVNDSLNTVNERLENFYLGKGKLNQNEITIFKNVLIEISNDLKDGGISRGLYEYLSPHMIDLNKEDFYKRYHQPLDYLLRLLRKEIATRLVEK